MSRSTLRRFGSGITALLIGACGSDTQSLADADGFDIDVAATAPLVEGADEALLIPVALRRNAGHVAPISLSVTGGDESDLTDLSIEIEDTTLSGDDQGSGLRVRLGVAAAPIAAATRRLVITASDGQDEERLAVDIMVQPTDAPDVYLLIGQSNMVGFSGDATRQGETGGPDAPDERIRQLNVSGNDGFGTFTQPQHFTAVERNVASPTLTLAEDPLHVPRSDSDPQGEKDEQYIGLGLSFAKQALMSTEADIVLVPAAWPGSAFCANDNGPQGGWAVGATDPALGNDLLFERAVLRTDLALQASGGVLRGILWHQGESDANERCAPLYADNLDRLASALRQRIRVDARGEQARRADADVPFVVGTMSRGSDARGDLSTFGPSKQSIDEVTRATPQRLPYSAVSLHDDLVPANGFPCGSGDCVHFGAAALREMGSRYHSALERALVNAPQP